MTTLLIYLALLALGLALMAGAHKVSERAE